MKTAAKIVLALVAVPALPVAAALLAQAYYHLTPAAPSVDAQMLDARVALRPAVTENGYRAYGVLAPRGDDPVRYGRCLADAQQRLFVRRQSRTLAATAPDDDTTEVMACRRGAPLLPLPTLPSDIRITPSTVATTLAVIADARPDDELLRRDDIVWTAGPRRLGATPESPLPPFDVLARVTRWRIADAARLWHTGARDQAIATWRQVLERTTACAGDTLIDAMISVNLQTQTLLAIQYALVAATDAPTAEEARALQLALASLEQMPERAAESMLGEWQLHRSVVATMGNVPRSPFSFDGQDHLQNMFARFGPVFYDQQDTLNAFARNDRWLEHAFVAAARAQPVPAAMETIDTPSSFLLLPFSRNPVGRLLAAIAAPMYGDYGTRVADLRNLAAATRLTIAARAGAVPKSGFAAFIAAAAPDQRDVFTGRPFAFDAVTGRLQMQLRVPSTVLGEARYELPL